MARIDVYSESLVGVIAQNLFRRVDKPGRIPEPWEESLR